MFIKRQSFTVEVCGHKVQGTTYTPPTPVGNLIIQGAIGVTQRQYASFAAYMAQLGFRSITYDYSGTGKSRSVPVRHCDRKPSTWGREDQAAVLAWTRRTLPDTPVCIVGHSLGGQLIGFAPVLEELDAVVLVAAQDPHVGHWTDPMMRMQAAAIWKLVFPGASYVLGFVPGRLYGGYSLSAPTCKEGTRWATSTKRLLDEPGVREKLASIRAPVFAYSFSDDRLHAPREAVDALARAMSNAQLERLHLDPKAVGLQRIGHAGFFSPRSVVLWDALGQRLSACVLDTKAKSDPPVTHHLVAHHPSHPSVPTMSSTLPMFTNASAPTTKPTPFPHFAGVVVRRPACYSADVGTKAKLDEYTVAAYQYATSTRPDLCQPAAIIYAANESDVALAVKYAYDAGLALAIRSTGHHFGGYSSGNADTIQLDVYSLRGISDLHPGEKTITVGTAVTVMELDEKLASMGAFVVHGECAHVAVGGHMQSGGFSPMFLRSFGYFCDYITKFRIVLAPAASGEDPRTVEVIKPIAGQTSAENDELWYVVLGGSPGNFGVILDVTIKPLWDRDYPHSRGLAMFRMFKGDKGRRDLEAWIQLVAEYSDDDELPADYNFNVIMLAGNPPGPLDLNNNIDVKMAAEHPEIYGTKSPGCPCLIGLIITWTNLAGNACKFEDYDGKYCAAEIFADIERRTRKLDNKVQAAVGKLALAAGKVVYRRAAEMTGYTSMDGNVMPMSKLMIAAAFGARVQANPYVSAVHGGTSQSLSKNGFAAWSSKLAAESWENLGGWPGIQWGGVGGRHSRTRPEHAKNPNCIAHRQANFNLLYYVHYDNVIMGKDNDEPRRLALENCERISARVGGKNGYLGNDFRHHAFPNQDRDLDAEREHYYDSEEVYLRVLKAKRSFDPRDVFTPNTMCIGASRKYGTAPANSPALMSLEQLERALGRATEAGQ